MGCHRFTVGFLITDALSNFCKRAKENMQLAAMNHHKATLDAITKEKAEIVDKMHKTTLSIVDKTLKVLKVQKKLHDFERQLWKLTNERSQQLQQINNLEQKCIDAKTKYTALKKGYYKQQKAELARQSQSRKLLEIKLQSTNKKLFATEKHCDELQQLNQDISTKASNTAQCLQIEIEQQKLIINELSSNNRDVRAAYVTEKMALDDKIEALKQANEQLKAAAEAKAFEDQQKLNKRDEQIAELKKLEQQNLHLTKFSSAENSELAKQLLSLQEVHEVSRTSFRDKLQQKDDNIATCNGTYAEMERQKNITIAELKLKINQISKAFDQSIGSGRGTKQQEINMKPTTTIELQKDTETVTALQPVAAATSSQALDESISKIAAEVESSTSEVGYRPMPCKRPIYQYNSDSNTDDDQESD